MLVSGQKLQIPQFLAKNKGFSEKIKNVFYEIIKYRRFGNKIRALIETLKKEG